MLKSMKLGNISKIIGIALMASLFAVVGIQAYSLAKQKNRAGINFVDFRKKLQQAKNDHDKLSADLNYYLNPENLKKELKGSFNYKEAGENMVILINRNHSSTPSSSSRSH